MEIAKYYKEHSKVINITAISLVSAFLLWRLYKYMFVTFDDFVKIILKNEGGLVNDPKDPGGLTKYGISQRSYPNLNIKNLTEAKAKAIYKSDFWNPLNISGLKSDSLKLQILDHGVNAGKSSAAKLLQQLVKSKVTGKETISNDDIKKANDYLSVGTDLTKYYKDLRKTDYKTKKNYPIYGPQWLKRVDNTVVSFF